MLVGRKRSGRRRGGLGAAVAAVAVVATMALVPMVPAGADDTAPDVPTTSPFHDQISWLLHMGYATGWDDGTYRPAAPVSRQAFVTILMRLSETAMHDGGGHGGHGSHGEDRMTMEMPSFSDVPMGHPFHDGIMWAAMHGLVEGYGDGTFRPEAPVSRQALAAILHRLSGIHPDLGMSEFWDVGQTHPFRPAIAFAGDSNLAHGYADGAFHGDRPVSRQALAAFLWRFDQMMGHYWPAADHHEMECTDPITEEQQAAADQLVEDVEASLGGGGGGARWPKVEDAIAAGYRFIAPPFGGSGAHYGNNEFTSDGIMLDPLKPENLMYDSNGDVEGAMFVMEEVGPHGPQVGGCLTLWHGHNDLCWTGPMQTTGTVNWIIDFGPCPAGTMLRMTPTMLHVWVDGRADPFEGLET